MRLLIVNYHYFREESTGKGIYPITKSGLLHQIDELSKSYEFLNQEDFIEILSKKDFRNRNYCLLTFDDGLKEQMLALDALNEVGIPAVFFVSTLPIEEKKVLNVHKLHYIRSIKSEEFIFNFINSIIEIDKVEFPKNLKSLYRYDTNLKTKKIKYLLNFILDEKSKHQVIDLLFNELVENESKFSEKLYMSIEDIGKLSQVGYLGTHTHSHLPLAQFDSITIKSEIEKSLYFLKSNNAIDVKSISYPYGGPKAVSNTVVNEVKKFNLDFGLTMFRGLNTIDDLSNPLMLKRVDTNDAPGGKLQSKEFIL